MPSNLRAPSGMCGSSRRALATHKYGLAAVCAAVVRISYRAKSSNNRAPTRRYLKPGSGCPRCSRRRCLCALCSAGNALSEHCLRRRPVRIPSSLMLFELNDYDVNAVQLHVSAADVLVRCGIDRKGFR